MRESTGFFLGRMQRRKPAFHYTTLSVASGDNDHIEIVSASSCAAAMSI
ncbi:MAG: hypothetical protein AAB857_00910 [Patescibacteria group bacterium]